jgi:hypothetical protein
MTVRRAMLEATMIGAYLVSAMVIGIALGAVLPLG